ncbi:galactose mutarotase [Puniceicoccaceae bacterium K14]|nr:galactose mutarotase [Puniceicoccaceae bacterium K14]
MAIHTLKNKNGLEMKVSSLGGVVMEFHVPDREGNFADIALGFDSEAEYDERSPFFGALIGRFGNRIAQGKYSIDGIEYSCVTNNGENSLHGGQVGFDKREWDVSPISGDGYTGLRLRLLSGDGDEGFPGNLEVEVLYKLTDDNEWIIEYRAITDKPTIVNLTQHSYFNLKGHNSGTHCDHEISLNADQIVPVGSDLIPTGELMPVDRTPFDLRKTTIIEQGIDVDHPQIEVAGGYDHTFVLNKSQKDELSLAGTVSDSYSGRSMKVYTTEPGVQFYTGNFIENGLKGKSGTIYQKRSGFCLETQHYPDSPNQPNFPSTRLAPGEIYLSKTVYAFEA